MASKSGYKYMIAASYSEGFDIKLINMVELIVLEDLNKLITCWVQYKKLKLK